MSLILNIDTSTNLGSVCIARDNEVIAMKINEDPKTHASFLQPAIEQLCNDNNIRLAAIDAVAVANGPGSYTGLRVGLSSAKGICFALNKPLILVNTLEIMALAAIETVNNNKALRNVLFCPMIDARRNEVFTGLYNSSINEQIPPDALILTENTFENELNKNIIYFSGNGSIKAKTFINHQNAFFLDIQHSVAQLSKIAFEKWQQKCFSDVAYAEPFYLKAFYTPTLR